MLKKQIRLGRQGKIQSESCIEISRWLTITINDIDEDADGFCIEHGGHNEHHEYDDPDD